MRLHEFQTDHAVRWRRELGTWIMPFSVNGQSFELHMMPSDRENPVTEKFSQGVDIAFGRMIRDAADEPPEMHTDNTSTARNAARTVFSYVLSGIVDFCSKNDPAFIEFQASRDQGKSSLYKSMYAYLERNKASYGFQSPKIEDGWGHDVFVLWHKDALEV